jgi:hypothetical protein
MPHGHFTLIQETPEGSVFKLTVGKAPEGRPHGSHHPPSEAVAIPIVDVM